jgi:hypothetical protein
LATCFLTITSLREEHKVFSNKFGIYKNYLYLCSVMIKDKKLRAKYKDYTHISWKHFPMLHGEKSYITSGDWVTRVEDYNTGDVAVFINGELYKDYGKR